MKYEIGISANCEGDSSVINTLDNIKMTGIKNIMITQRSPEFENQIIHALKLGLKIPYVHLEFIDANYLWSKGEINKKYINAILDGIKICHRHGIKIAIMHPTAGNAVTSIIEPNEHGLESMKTILKAAEQCGVKIAVENTDLNTSHLTYLLDNIHSPYLGFCYDCGHHYLYTPKMNWIKKYADRCLAVHLHDNVCDWTIGKDWTRDLHAIPFSGKINFEKVVKDIVASSYKGVFMLEVYRVSYGDPKFHANLTPTEFLKEAQKYGKKLVQMSGIYKNL